MKKMGAHMMAGMEDEETPVVPSLTTKMNSMNMLIPLEAWGFGPETATPDPKANAGFWANIAAAWKIDTMEARRRNCGNCEYGNNTVEAIAAMETVDMGLMDWDGGGRVFCHKFHFVGHNLRACKAWDGKEFKLDPEEA